MNQVQDAPEAISKDAFLRAAVTQHGPQLARYFASRLPDATEASDLVQEVYLRLLKIDRPELIRCPQAYLYTVAANIAREHWLKRTGRPHLVPLDEATDEALLAKAHPFAAPDPQDVAAATQRVDHLSRLLEQLSPKVRAALIWAHRDGHTYEEISQRLAVRPNRVKKYLARAIAHCRHHGLMLLDM